MASRNANLGAWSQKERMLEKPRERVTIIAMDWKDTVKDQDEIKVFLALDGPTVT
jgi:hypothetical protein